jgi:regulator of sigma E protease
MVGEDPEEEVSEADRQIAFQYQPLWKRMAIVLAGPGTNLLFAFVAFSLVFMVYGARLPSEAAKVGGIIEGMPAAKAGVVNSDLITAVDGVPIEKWERLSEVIRASGGKTLTLTVRRAGAEIKVQVTPEAKPDKNLFGETLGTAYVIGIERGFDEEKVGIFTAIGMGAQQTAWWIETLVVSIAKMFQGKIPAKDIGGPILIVQAAGQQARLGLEYLLHFMAVISVNLGVLNLLPIPVLDGGHIFIMGMLIALMAFAFYNDIARVVQGWG